MLKSSKNIKSVLLVGGTSTIGLAIVRELARHSELSKVTLAGRQSRILNETLDALQKEMPDTLVEFVEMDLTQTGTLCAKVQKVIQTTETDIVLMAAGVLPTNQGDTNQVLAAVKINYLGPLEVCSQVIESFKSKGKGTLVVLSSVAAIRPRSDNYLYGSTKSGLDFWARGIAENLRGTAVHVMVVRPGMVETKMSQGMERAPMTCLPEDVALAVVAGLKKNSTVVWVPGKIKVLITLVNILPLFLYRRLKVRKSSPTPL